MNSELAVFIPLSVFWLLLWLFVGGQSGSLILDTSFAPLRVLVGHGCGLHGSLFGLEFHQVMVRGEIFETVSYGGPEGIESVFFQVSFHAFLELFYQVKALEHGSRADLYCASTDENVLECIV